DLDDERKSGCPRRAVALQRRPRKGRLSPALAVNFCNDRVKTDAIKEKCKYTLTFCRPYINLPPDRVILRREVSFNIRNIRNKTIDFLLKSFITDEEEDFSALDREGKPVVVPRHVAVVIDGGPPLPLQTIINANERGSDEEP
ncbi:MAG: hypothetical protein M3O15_05480, partial [Acidobacteriota bacterium]|nr:hypothetical protein [Acidobacteriota bacterium]